MGVWPLSKLSRRQQLAAVAFLAVVVGAFVAPQVYGQTTSDDGKVAVIEVNGIITSATAQQVEDDLREARHNESIEAVVLDIDSGGGAPASSERMFTAVERTSEEMPVLAAVDTAGASGAYYTMLSADEIYVAPTSQVGSVGVVGPAPTPTGPNDGTTAPDKGTFHPDDDRAQTETLKQVFLESVMEYRGDELEKDRETVAHARTYPGVEAVENGFADELGYLDDAIYEAADRAGMDSFDVVTKRSETAAPGLLFETNGDGEVVVTDETTELNPYQPQYVTEAVWYELFGDLDLEAPESSEHADSASNETAATSGGEQP